MKYERDPIFPRLKCKKMGPCEEYEQGPYLILLSNMPWHVYIIQCRDNTLYTGITNNLERRIKAHNSGNGGRFTKYRAPVKLLYSEECLSRPAALKREAQIKSLEREEKLKLVVSNGDTSCVT